MTNGWASPQPRESCTCFPPLPLLMLGCSLHGCPSPGHAFSTSCSSQQPVWLVLMPVRDFDVDTSSVSALVFRFDSESLPRCKNQFSLLPTPPFIPANFSEQIQGVLCGEKLYYRSSLDAELKVTFKISSWEEYLATEQFFSRQGFSCECWCFLVGGQVKEGAFLMCNLFKGAIVTFHHAGCTHHSPPPSQLAHSRAFLAVKQGLSILSFSELWGWWIEGQWGPGLSP